MLNVKKLIRKIKNLLNFPETGKKSPLAMEQISQVAIKNQYVLMKNMCPHAQLPNLIDTGFQVYSQFDEDGILLYIFSMIGFTNRRVLEICAGSGDECNSANLIINHACEGLLFDGDKQNIDKAKKFFGEHRSTWLCPPKCVHAWITKDNINELIQKNNFHGSIDLFSLDIDGNDYWLWKEINCIQPRVVICETHNIIPDNMSVTIPYKEDFNYTSENNYHEEFRSASPLAMITLAKQKGYRLIGSHKYGFNLIFIRNDIGTEFFPEIKLCDISNNPYTKESKKTRWDAVKDAPWVNVE